ncbi:hypothetical protein ELQ92_08055 [Labedella populi]|uniref:Uncharacterized protein n=1 Tax=Labedella populi TaxID=2498850 RepID=A0A444QDF2_9MICO|nr:hypothetical protein [Labedella populi]RWZ64681.1 hypothetical protein ELQ92_08055 [Labedella populi]
MTDLAFLSWRERHGGKTMDNERVAAHARSTIDVAGLFVNLDHFDAHKPSAYRAARRTFHKDRSACPATRSYSVRLAFLMTRGLVGGV